MKRLCSLVVVMLCAAPLVAQTANPSPETIAARSFDVMAGPAWDDARYIAFSFNVERDGSIVTSFPQAWDRWSGLYRVEGLTPDGKPFVVIMNVATREGRAWSDGSPVADPAELLKLGYRRFINDTYWLLMPLKLRDPGTTLGWDRQETNDCGSWDVLRLSFGEGVGLTPGDVYWPWINRETGLVDFWEMRLESMERDATPRKFRFMQWERRGGLLLSTVRAAEGSTARIRLDDVTISRQPPAGIFDAP